MSLISWSTTSLISGVSQQPDTLRFASQAEVQENGFSSIVDGLSKRHPTEHVTLLTTTAILGSYKASLHTINRDVSERYLVIFFGSDGGGGALWVWDIENDVLRTVEGPDGTGHASGHASFDPPNWDYLNTTHPSKLRAMSVADNTFVVNPTVKVEKDAAVLDDMSTDAFIFVRSSNYKSEYTATFDLYKSGSGTESVSASVNTWNGTTSTQVANKDRITITSDPSAFPASYVWTAYFLGSSFIYTQTVNRSADQIATSISVLINAGNGLSASSPGTHIDVEGDYGGLDIRGSVEAATSPAGGTMTIGETQAYSTTQDEMVHTNDIAAELATKLTAAAVAGGANATFIVSGSVIRCVPKYGADGTDANPDFKGVQLEDSNANSLMELTHKKVDTVTNLPLTCLDGFKVEVQGNAEAAEDNFYLEFEAKDGAGVFGAGIWKETALGGEQYKLKKTTMPHRLERFFTAGGVPYFIWDAVDWVDRSVGDVETTNSFPSFTSTATADNYITDVFFFRSRMGFLSNDNIILSEIGKFENFFRTATTAVLDGDPIDVGVGHSSVAMLHSAVAWNEKLVIFSDQTQFVLSGEPYLTPQTVQVSAVTDFENYTSIRPLTSGQGIAFGYSHGDFSGIRELNQVNENVYSADDLTQAIPKYIKGTITTFAPTTLENMLVVLADGDTSSLYVYKYYFGEGQRLQAAWSKYTLGAGANIHHVAFIENTLYITVLRTEGLFVEKMVISDGQSDPDSNHVTTLDRRVADTDCTVTYTSATDTTEIVLPYDVESSATYQVVSRATDTSEAGHIYTLSVAPTGNTITVVGDVETESPFWVGEKYNLLYQFSAPRLREATSTRGGRGIVATGRQQIKYGTLVYDETSYFKVTVTPEGREGQANEFSSIVLDASTSLIGKLRLDSGDFRFPIHSKNDQVTLTLENDSPLPSNFISVEWEADYTSQSKRYRG